MHVKPCTCNSDKSGNPSAAHHQDAKLGKGMRYHNKGADSKVPKFRCTVCGAVK